MMAKYEAILALYRTKPKTLPSYTATLAISPLELEGEVFLFYLGGDRVKR